jgi:hypothetical protein
LRTNHNSCPLNKNPNRKAFYLMARPDQYDIHDIFGTGIVKYRNSPFYGRHMLKPNKLKCLNCEALMFPEEKLNGSDDNPIFSLCCSKQKFKLPPLRQLPLALRRLLDSSTTLGKHFLENIRKYNSMFSFTSFNASVYIVN